MDGVRVVTNLPEFRQQLRAIGADMERKAVREAGRAAIAVFRKVAQQHAPMQKPPATRKGHVVGTLRRAIYTRRMKSPKGRAVFRLGFRQGTKERAKQRDAYYWAWVEQGHIARGPGQRLKGGANTRALARQRIRASGKGFVEGRFFLKRSYESAQSRALDAFYERLGRAVQKYSQQ